MFWYLLSHVTLWYSGTMLWYWHGSWHSEMQYAPPDIDRRQYLYWVAKYILYSRFQSSLRSSVGETWRISNVCVCVCGCVCEQKGLPFNMFCPFDPTTKSDMGYLKKKKLFVNFKPGDYEEIPVTSCDLFMSHHLTKNSWTFCYETSQRAQNDRLWGQKSNNNLNR